MAIIVNVIMSVPKPHTLLIITRLPRATPHVSRVVVVSSRLSKEAAEAVASPRERPVAKAMAVAKAVAVASNLTRRETEVAREAASQTVAQARHATNAPGLLQIMFSGNGARNRVSVWCAVSSLVTLRLTLTNAFVSANGRLLLLSRKKSLQRANLRRRALLVRAV
jgi:hypothetical protein